MRPTPFVVAAIVLAVVGCEPGKRPVMQAQFCLTPENGPDKLIDISKSVARDEGMDYFQRGYAPKDLSHPFKVTSNGSSQTLPRGFEVAVSSTDDSEGFSAAVSGAPSNQVMVGFRQGRDRRLSMAFASRVIGRLRQKWDVRLVSGDVGMFPLKNC